MGGDLDISKDLTIQGAGSSQTIIDGNNLDRVIEVDPGGVGIAVFLTDVTIRNGNGISFGGGILNHGTLTLTNVVVTGNSAGFGGNGICNACLDIGGLSLPGTLTVIDSTISNNPGAGTGGGGVCNGCSFFQMSPGTVTLVNSTVSGNEGSFGAGLSNGGINGPGGSVTLTNVTLSGNSGDGIQHVTSGSLSLTHVTVAGNAGYGIVGGPPGVSMKGALAANNTSGDCAGSIASAGHNLIHDKPLNCTLTSDLTGNIIGQDPLLGPLAANGGPTYTHKLLAGSPAVDAGPNCPPPDTDQRGVARPQGPGCDIGAYEVPTSFADVSANYWAQPWIEGLFGAGVTSGCATNPLRYCPEAPVTREQMAVFLLKVKLGAGYTPPACTTPPFADVPCSSIFAPWIAELVARGITAGCGGGGYCPTASVTREQMAVFLLKTLEGAAFTPPACATATFTDAPCSSAFAPWVEELVRRGITAGCAAGRYCPGDPVTRAQMAVFLVKAFDLPL